MQRLGFFNSYFVWFDILGGLVSLVGASLSLWGVGATPASNRHKFKY